MLGQEKPQDFELVELLIREAGSNVASTSTQQGSDFESFKARFQSYVDQVPSYLHSVAKQGFFPHFFLGSFSTFIDTEIAAKLDIEKICFCFDGSQTLKVAVIRKGDIKGKKDVIDKIRLFVISEKGAPSATQKFSYGELRDALGRSQPARFQPVFDNQGELRIKSVTIDKGNVNQQGVLVAVENKKLHEDDALKDKFQEIKRRLWQNPESDIAKLTDSDAEEVSKPLEKILKKVSEIHSEYRDSLVYANQAREAAHHGFVAGALVNFRYRHNLRVYLEQFAGRGYADIVLVPRGKDRSLNAVPIIIELKAATKEELKELERGGKVKDGSQTTPAIALEQAKGYAKGFQPNTMRVLTISDNVLCVGLNLDSTESEKFSMYISPREDREIAPPTMQALLKEASEWNGRQDTITNVKEKIKQPLERIYHTFPGTPEKGGNYFSRFLLGQLLLADKFVDIDLEKSVFLYNEYPLASSTRSGAQSTERPVTTFMLTKGNQGQNKEVFVFHIREGGKGEFSEKKIPINLPTVGKVTEVCISLQEERKSDFFDVEKVNRYNSLNEYKQGKNFFDGEWKNIPYPAKLKETFDRTLESQHVPQSASVAPDSSKLGKAFDNYKGLLEKIGEGILPFKPLIEKEAHFQAVLHGAFSYYSDLQLGESSRALVLTEFQTGRGKRIDMLVHGIKFADQASSAKEYNPVGLELKGPRGGVEIGTLKAEANNQIGTEYEKGVTYKTLTDGTEVAFMGVIFNKGANNADSLILMSKDKFAPVKVVHSSIFSISQQQIKKNFNLNPCVKDGGRSRRSINPCLFSKDDVEKFSKGRVDENNVDKIIIDSEKFLTYIKNSQDEAKNAQLVEFIGDKNIEGDRRHLLDKVIEDQGYERYIQNERIKDLHGDISQKTSSAIKSSKLKGRLMNAAGGIQLIRGIHGAIVSCEKGTATDCGLNLGGIAWSFASQPIENVMVKITPKVVASAERVVGKVIPGTLGKQTKFAIRIAGVKFGGAIARGTAGAITGVFDIVDISMSASNLVDCKKREDSDNPCGEKEIRDNIASISFSSVSFISGVALAAASMPVIGTAVGFGLMVGYGVYSGVSNIVEYKKKYDTTHGENWSIFWHTLFLQPMPLDIQTLEARSRVVNSVAKEAWRALNSRTDGVVAYAVGFGDMIKKVSVDCRPSGPCTCDTNQFGVGFHKKCDLIELYDKAGHAVIAMDKKSNANMENLSRVIPDNTKGASMICLPQITNQDYEKGRTSSVPSAEYYCENAMVISHNSRVSMKQKDKTIVYDLRNVDGGNIVGNNVWNNNFLIYSGTERIIGGNNVVNRFVLVDNIDFSGKMIGGNNSTNILDLSQLKDTVVGVKFNYRFKTNASGPLKAIVNNRLLINDSIDNNGIFNYYYVGRKNKVDKVLCMGYSEHFTGTDDRDVIIDSGGGFNNNEKDIVENCKKVIISPYTAVRGRKSNYAFYVKTADYKGRNLYSEIDVNGTGTVIFSEIDLLGDCDQITYSTSSNTLSLKINVGQNNQFTLDIKNYVEKSSNKPHFVLIDKNGSNIIPKIERSDSSTIEIKSFELHSEHSLDNFDDVESHYEKILNNHKSYKVFGVIRDEVQDQDNSTVPHMVFGSSGDDIINFDQGTMVAKGRDGSDIYIINGDVRKREVIIDNNSDDKELDTVFVQEVPKEFLVQKCDLHLNYNSTNIQVKNYFQNDSYKHLMVMNSKGETFIPYVQSMSCSSMGNGKLVPFFHVTQTQNMFMLPKDFQDDHVVIDSRLEDIARYRDKDNLLLVGNSEVPFIVRVEDFYNDQSRWRDVNFSLWNNGNFSPYFGLQQEVDRVTAYQDKLKNDYEKTIKEYVIDFTKSINITHNQNDTLNSIEEDEKRIGVMILKDITPDRVEVFSSSADLIFRDKKSNRTVNIKSWNNNESYRISTLEFDLGLEPMIIRRLGRFSLSEVREIQALIDKSSENYQNKGTYTPKIENDFKCLISMDGFENTNPTYKCLGFSSLQDQISFTENLCSKGQIEEFRGKIPNNIQVLSLLIKLHNDLLLSSYNQSTIDQCNYLMITSELEVSKLLHLAANNNDLNRIKFLLDNGANVEVKDNDGRTLLNVAACNGNLDMNQLIFDRIEAKSNDPSKMIKLIKSLKEEIISQANIQSDVKEWAESRVSDLRNSIKDVAVKRLKDGMVNDRYTSTIELAKEIYIFENKLFSDVIKEVINNVYGKVDTEKILNFIHSHDQIEQKAYGYVAVFEKMESKNNLNDNAVFKLAYYVKEIIDSGRRSDLESLKNRLPESLKNVMFSSVVCIKNVEYGRYLYSPNNDCMYHLNNCDRDRRYVFTWPSNGNNDQFKWRVEFNGNNVYLKNVAYGRYLYSPNDDCTYHLNDCDSNRRYAFTWPSNRGGSNFKWKVELNGDNVYLKNVAYGRYLYSPNDDCTYHLNNCDRDRRYVFTWKSGERVTNGVWKIEDCGFNIKKRDVINQSADIKARDNNGETSLHTAIQYSNAFNANVGFHSDIVRVSRQAKSNSEISVYYIKGVEDESRHVQINLASSVKATGNFQGLANKIVLNQEAISHLNKVRKVSGILMHGMIAKNALADFLNGDYKGVAINLGFIGSGQGLAKIAKAANAKGVGLITEGKLLLGRSLKAASPFLSRSTSAFVVYDLVNQIKELESGDKDALIPVIGDSIYLGIDAAEVGIEVAEVFGALEGVSSVTGPIGTAIGTVVFIGTDIYMAIKRVGKIDEIVHLTSGERFIEGLRAFVGMKPEQYIGKLMGEKQANDQLVRQGLKYLKQHNDIQRYVFPTGKLVEDNDRCITVTERGPCTGMTMCSPSITEKVQCQEKIQVDLDSVALFDKKVDNVIYSRTKPDAPNEGKLFCLPTGSKRSDSKGENAYFCYNSIGLSCSANRTGNYTFIDLGEGNDVSRGFIDSPNIFVVNNGFKQYYGGNKDDRFILQGNFIEGNINGGDGIDTVDLDEFASEVRSIQAKLGRSGYVSYNNSSFEMENINEISARKDKSDTITCDYNTKYVDGRGGESYDNPDIITIPKNSDFHEMQLIVRPSTNITNHAYNGDFNYTILSGKGRAQINLSNLLGGTPTDRHNFFFNYTLSELININIRNISRVPYYNYTIREAVFSFSSPLSQNKSINEKFNVTISGIPANASYVLSDNTEIKIGKNNLYAIHNTNKTIDEIVKSYPAVADHLRMSLFVNTNNETVVIGHGNHDVISNNFLQRSHLIGSGGENVYVITSSYEILDIENLPIPEVIVYDDFNKKESLKDTLDLRQLVQQVNSDLSIEPISNVIKDENDILIKLSISATGLQQDVATVRLKDAFANNWYKELQIILNSVPVKIDDDLDLKPLPLTFNKEIVVVTPQDVEEKDKLIISKEAGQYTFLHSGYDLIITNAFNADIETNKLCTIYFKDFYKESKMETLSIKFTDKEILLSDEMDKINNADSISDKLNINDYISSIVKLQESSEPSEAASSNHPIRHRRHKDNSRREDGVHHVRHKHHKVQEHNNNYQNNRYYIDQPEITTSSGARPSSWINDLFSWVKSSVGGLFYSGAALPGKFKKILTQDLSEGSIIINKKVEDETPKTVENIVGMHDEVLGKLNKMDIKKLKNLCKEFKIKWNPKVDIHQCIRNTALSLNSICDVEGGYAGDSCANSLVESIEQLYKLNDKTEQLKKINQDISNLYNQDSNIILLTYLIGWYRKIKLKDEREDIHDKIYKIAYEVLKEVGVCKTISTYAIPIDISEDDIYTTTLGKMILNGSAQKDQIVEVLLCSLENLIEIKLKEDKNKGESDKIKECMRNNVDVESGLGIAAEDIISHYSKFSEKEKYYYKELCAIVEQKNTSKSIYDFVLPSRNNTEYNSNLIGPVEGITHLQQKVEQVSKISDQPTSSVSRSEILKKLQDIKNILNKSIQNKSAIKSPLYNNIVKDIRGNIKLTRKNHDQKEEVLKNLRDIHKSCIAICELIQGDCWDSLKHSLSNNLPLSNKYNFKAAYTNLSIVVEVLKLLYDRDLCRTVIDSDENISLNGVISLQGKMKKELKKMQSYSEDETWLEYNDIANLAENRYHLTSIGRYRFDIVGDREHLFKTLKEFRAQREKERLTLIVNVENQHWVTLVATKTSDEGIKCHYADSFGKNEIPCSIIRSLGKLNIEAENVSIKQQKDTYNCGIFALANAKSINLAISRNVFDRKKIEEIVRNNTPDDKEISDIRKDLHIPRNGLEKSNIKEQQKGFNLGSERPQSCLNNVFVQNHLSQDLPPGKSVYLIS